MIDFYKTKALEATKFNMAATFLWCEDNGAGVTNGAFYRGSSRTTGRSDVNWKNVDDSTTSYVSSPVTAGNNSFTKFLFGVWTGAFNEIKSGFFAHTYGGLDSTYYTLHCRVSGSGMYPVTPDISTNTLLIHNITSSGSITTGLRVGLGINGPEWTGKSQEGSTGYYIPPWGTVLYSDYCATQLRTQSSAPAGNLSSGALTLTMSWTEN